MSADKPLRLLQLSDCHVSAEPGVEYRGADPRANLQTLLGLAAAWRPDLLAVTGDLSEDYNEGAYRYLRGCFASLGVPVLTLPGNHDDPSVQRAIFEACPVDEPWVHDAGGWRVILLNSAVEGKVPGQLSASMCDGLAAALADRSLPKLVFLHHQPIPVGSPWIDRYPLRNPQALWRLLDGRDDVRAVAWGHIHQPFTARRGSVALLGAPSTAVNSQPTRERFTADERGPACRWFELRGDGRFETGLLGDGWPATPPATASTG